MPQIDQIATIYASQLVWLAVVFAFIYFAIGRAMLPRIQGTVEGREARIAADIAQAEQARAEANAADEAYQIMLDRSRAAAQAAAAKAQSEATGETEQRLKAADAEAQAKIARAEDDLAARAAQAEREIDAIATEVVQEIVAKVAGFSVDQDAAARAVRASLAA
jgi:F-type H+-transporting ATPase subunit b